MNIDWKKIEKECPKSYKKFVLFMRKTYYYAMSLFDGILKKGIWNKNLNQHTYCDICYCDLEKFFDENGIYINGVSAFSCESFVAEVRIKNDPEYINIAFRDNPRTFKTQPESKLEAVYKAFSIMEAMND